MVRFELLWSARDGADFAALRDELAALTEVPIGRPVWRRAIEVFEKLARSGPLDHRRVAIPDLRSPRPAEEVGMLVVHYERDFELIAEVTGQPMRAIAPLSSLGYDRADPACRASAATSVRRMRASRR